jgi:hypothetical protein
MNTFWNNKREARAFLKEVYRGDPDYRLMRYARDPRRENDL